MGWLSGGDRHGLEPNANINLTNVENFTEFFREIRVERVSRVLFMEQYGRPWEQRIMESTLDAVMDHPEFSPGWQLWDERAFHPDVDGTMKTLRELWTGGRAPLPLRLAILLVRLMRHDGVSRALGAALRGKPGLARRGASQEIA